MKFSLAQTEIQALIAKALSLPVEKVTVSSKSMDVTIETDIGSLSFAETAAPVVSAPLAEADAEENSSAESAPASKDKGKGKSKKSESESEPEEIIEEEEEDDDNISFL